MVEHVHNSKAEPHACISVMSTCTQGVLQFHICRPRQCILFLSLLCEVAEKLSHAINSISNCSMTSGAQQALRRTMELHSATTRFALACNQSSKIIEPIQSRCAIVRFMKLSNEDVLKRAKWVAEQEGVAYDPSGLEAITFTADGDMRQALNNLQATVAGFGFVNQVCLHNTPCKCATTCTYHPRCVATFWQSQ